jgi:hypothetical protein
MKNFRGKEEDVILFKAIYGHLFGGTKDNHENHH